MVKALLCALTAMGLGGCGDIGGTLVTFTLTRAVFESNQDVGPSDDFHLELFATVNGGAVNLLSFELLPTVGTGALLLVLVVDQHDPDLVLGAVDGFDQFLQPIGGIRFRSTVVLENATELFITRKRDGDTDPAPGRDIVLACTLAPRARGTIGCSLRPPNKDAELGTAVLVPNADGVNPL